MLLSAGTIATAAGSLLSGEGGPATAAALSTDYANFGVGFAFGGGVVLDGSGNVYFATTSLVRKLSSTGVVTTVGGTGMRGYAGDGGQALAAQFNPAQSGLALDASGDLYVADSTDNVVREIKTTGIVTTVAGNGTSGYSGDGGPATSAQLFSPEGVAVDSSGNLYIGDSFNSVVREVSSTGTISTFAGNGTRGDSGFGGAATSASLGAPQGVSVDSSGNVFIADGNNAQVEKVSAGIITIVAGGGTGGFGGLATSAALPGAADAKVDASGNIFVADGLGVDEVTASNGDINRISGGAPTRRTTCPDPGATGLPPSVSSVTAIGACTFPDYIAVDSSDHVYASDWLNNVTELSSGTLSTVAGNGYPALAGDGGPGPKATLSLEGGLAFDQTGDLFIGDTFNSRVRRLSAGGTISSYAGSGYPTDTTYTAGSGPFSAPAANAVLGNTTGIGTDAQGDVYMVDWGYSQIDKILPSGTLTTFAGIEGSYGYSGDGGPATSAQINGPEGLVVDTVGDVYFADTGNYRVRKITPAGTITTVAGNGTRGYTGDGGAATSAELKNPTGIAVDTAGNLYIVDNGAHVVRKVTTGGTISTIAGTGTAGFSGDGGAATAAQLSNPWGAVIDSGGTLFIADGGNNRVRKVTTGGTISTIAGNGNLLASGDGGAATSAGIGAPYQLAIDGAGNLYFDDAFNARVREVGLVGAAGILGGSAVPPVGGPVGGPTSVNETQSPSQICVQCQQAALNAAQTSDPVDAETGNFTHTFTDLATPGKGAPLDFTRTYRSATASTVGPFGYGWSFSYGVSLTIGSGTATLNEEGGSQVAFTLPAGTPVAPRTEAALYPNQPVSGDYTLWREGGHFEQLVFNSSGQLIAETDWAGANSGTPYATSLAYSGGKLSTITDPAGRTYTVGWTGANITSLTDSSTPARTIGYSYDGSGNLTKVTDVAGGVTEFAYDTGHEMVTMALPRFGGGTLPGALATCASTPPQGVISNHYTAGRVDCQTDQIGRKTAFNYASMNYTTMSGSVLVTDPKANQTQDTYTNGLLSAQTKGYGSAVAATTQYLYDPNTVGIVGVIDPDGHATGFGYDAYGNQTLAVDSLGRATTSTYQFPDLLATRTDPNGVTTTYAHSGLANLTRVATPLLDASGNTIATQTTSYTYTDTTNPTSLTTMVDPGSNTWTYAYDAFGDKTSVTAPPTPENAAGDETLYGYDTTKGWVTSTVTPRGVLGGTTTTCTPPALGCTTYAHDKYGNVTVTTDALGHTTQKTYDADQNVATTTDGAGNVAAFTYDTAEQNTAVTHADGTVTKTDYNTDGTTLDTIDALGAKTSYAYDARARVTTVTDPLNRATTFGYDPAGNTVTKADPAGTCPAWPITYPPTLGTGAGCTVWQYDPANQLINTYYSDGVTPSVGTITYDADGQRLTMPDGVGAGTKTWSWTWDSLHRLTQVTDDQNNVVSYAYDLRNNATTITYPGTTGTVTRHFDAAGRMDSLTDPKSNVTTFAYDADSDPLTTTLPTASNIVDTNTFDNADRLTAITDKQGATTFASFTYGRTNANNLNSVTSTGVPTDNHSWAYDPQQRLAAADTTLYGYDGANQQTTTLAGATQYYDTANQLAGSVAGPGIILAGTTTAANATGTTLTVNYPAAEKSGDQLILGITMAYPNTLLSLPTGWTQVSKTSSGSTSGTSDTTYVLRHAAASETSVALTFSGTFARAATLAAYRGVNAATPVGATTTKTANGGTSIAIPSITPTTNGDRLVTITGALTTSPGTWSPPVLMTTRAQAVGANPVIALDDQGLQGTAATGTRTPTYSLTAQLVGVTLTLKPATTQPTATSYGYNTRGDRTGVTPPTGSATTLGYDQANRLTSYTKASTSETYTYSGDGLRMSKAGANTATNTWDTTAAVPLLLTDGTFSYVYGPSGPLEQIDNSGTVTWYHIDQLGTVRTVTNSSGTVTATTTYDSYGNLTASTGTVPRLGYNGQYTDPETGLLYLRARYYDPSTGQFLTRDPAVSLTLSAYTYVAGNPLNGADPTGLDFLPGAGGGGQAASNSRYCGLDYATGNASQYLAKYEFPAGSMTGGRQASITAKPPGWDTWTLSQKKEYIETNYTSRIKVESNWSIGARSLGSGLLAAASNVSRVGADAGGCGAGIAGGAAAGAFVATFIPVPVISSAAGGFVGGVAGCIAGAFSIDKTADQTPPTG